MFYWCTGGLIADAGSLLTVLALDLTPDCHVLDLCAAPGTKFMTMMQTFLPGNEYDCVDKCFLVQGSYLYLTHICLIFEQLKSCRQHGLWINLLITDTRTSIY